MKIQLKKAITHKGQELRELDVPLDKLTGNDLIDVEEHILRTGNPIQSTDFSRVYLIAIAARAAKIPVEVLRMMNAGDFNKVIMEVRNFLMNTDSGEDNGEAEALEAPEAPLTIPATFSDVSQSD